MTCIITKLTDREQLEHWRIIVTENDREIYHDSTSTKAKAISMLGHFLRDFYMAIK